MNQRMSREISCLNSLVSHIFIQKYVFLVFSSFKPKFLKGNPERCYLHAVTIIKTKKTVLCVFSGLVITLRTQNKDRHKN